MQELKDLCMRHRLRWQEVPVEKLNRLVRGNHQGVVAQMAAIAYVELSDILERVPEDETPLIVLFDGVTDVRNFGAIARSAECAGAHGLITPLKNSAPVNAEAIRSSAGALTTIPVCRVGSVRNTLKQLQTEGFQVVAATEKSRKLLYDADFRRPTVLVMGAEDTGISREVLKLCDEQLAIPMIGHIESLNVSPPQPSCCSRSCASVSASRVLPVGPREMHSPRADGCGVVGTAVCTERLRSGAGRMARCGAESFGMVAMNERNLLQHPVLGEVLLCKASGRGACRSRCGCRARCG